MEKRRLGRTELEVTVISFGGLPLQRCTMEEAGKVLKAVLDHGINFIDTARAYTDSEEKIGKYISSRRNEYFLASKSMSRDKAGMAKDIDTSLANLQTSYIDLYQVHNIKRKEDLEAVLAPGGALEALKEAKKAEKIRHIGITGHNVEFLIQAIQTNEFSTVQVPFNFIETKPQEKLIPLAKSMDIGIIAMKPLGGGQIDSVDLALRYLIGTDITVAIPGMDTVAQIEQNLASAKDYHPLTVKEREQIAKEAGELGTNFCRRCGYCMPCTVGIDIPQNFIFHRQYTRYGLKDTIPKRYAAFEKKASDCIECGECEKRCPYDIPIRKWLQQVAKDLG